jgi:CubicO group peptidase (beta-lactamase class C family)
MKLASERVTQYLQSEIDRGAFPSAQYVIGESGIVVAADALGMAVTEPERIAADTGTIYDLASLTKPLITSMLAVKLYERGLIDLNLGVGDYLADFASAAHSDDRKRITLRQLLTHTSGLPPWRPLYLEADSSADVASAIARAPFGWPPACGVEQVIYSDLNYILLGCVLERTTGERLESLARVEIIEPLGLDRTMFNPPASLKRQIAATERGQAYEMAAIIRAVEDGSVRRPTFPATDPAAIDDDLVSLLSRFPASPRESAAPGTLVSPHPLRRTDVIWGEVHDGNAFFLGGAAGHAGLFSTAPDVFILANQFLPGSRLLNEDALALFRENLTPNSSSARSIGWILAETPDCSAGPALGPRSFGHTGFTGTSVWIDPDASRVLVLLTNRIHPEVGKIEMKEPRQRFHSVAVAECFGD